MGGVPLNEMMYIGLIWVVWFYENGIKGVDTFIFIGITDMTWRFQKFYFACTEMNWRCM